MNNKKEEISELDQKFGKLAYGEDTSKLIENEEKIRQSVRKKLQNLSSLNGSKRHGDVLEFFASLSKNFSKGKSTGKNGKLDSVSEIVKKIESGQLNNIVQGDIYRISKYNSLDQIFEMIPELAAAVGLVADNIISPDSFTEQNLLFDVLLPGISMQAKSVAIDQLEDLKDKYSITQKIRDIVVDTLKFGDCFISVLNYDEEISKYVTESAEKFRLNKATSQYKYEIGEESTNQCLELGSIKDKTLTADIDKFMDKFISYERNFKDVLETDMSDSDFCDLALEAGVSSQKLTGSVVSILHPSQVVVVKAGDTVLGYYYFKDVLGGSGSSDGMSCITNSTSYNSGFPDMINKGMSNTNSTSNSNLFAELMTKGLAKKLNKKFIASNQQFKDFFLNILQTRRNIENVKVTFIPAKYMVHFHNGGSSDYGKSLLQPVLFFAKIYIASLMSALIQKVVNGRDREVYYIETGLDREVEGSVNRFISDMKHKEISTETLADVNSILNQATSSSKSYIPVVDGKKAVEMETFSGSDVSLDNEFLQFLLKSIISGTSVPSSMLDEQANVEFARTLTMQNGNFTRLTLRWASMFNNKFSDLFKILYTNEYGEDIDKLSVAGSSDSLTADSITASIDVKFPKPSTLDYKTIEESIGSVTAIVEFIINNYIGEGEELTEVKRNFLKKELIKKYMSHIDWALIEELVNQAMLDKKEEDLDPNKDTSDNAEDEVEF